MKLSEIALPTTGNTQGSTNQLADPNTLLSLQNVCKRGGKNPNTFELLSICRLLQTLKDGSFYKQSNPFEVNMSTSKELMDILRAMKPEDLCKTAETLNTILAIKDADIFYSLANPKQEYLMWLQFVQSREANESLVSTDNSLSEEMEADKIAKIVKSINQWMRHLRSEGEIADIEDALGEFSGSIRKAGLTRDKVYAAFRKQFHENLNAKGNLLAEMKSQKQLFPLLDEFFKTKEYSTKGLKAKGVGDETYGKKSMIYVTTKSPAQRKELEVFLKLKGVKVNTDYDPGKSTAEIQVTYFKGTNWDE